MMLSESTKRSSKSGLLAEASLQVTWKALIEFLYDIELKTLAKEIETAKISPLLFRMV